MTTPQPTERAPARDDGFVTLLTAATTLAVLLLAGLVADGGAKIRAARHAEALAAEAARAAGQAIRLPQAMQGRPAVIDRGEAVRAGAAYLRAARVAGSVVVTGPTEVSVTVTIRQRTALLSLIGITHLTVHGHATAHLATGVTREEQ